ncbi:MAG: ATP-grasp domain-containing protein [Bacteroidetes bacterium]|nr:ATP-grasp domain-containing protein [Bacteroidota bacterium]
MGKENVKIAVVYNEPLNDGQSHGIKVGAQLETKAHTQKVVDLSEVGVLEARLQIENALRRRGYLTASFNIDGSIIKLINFLEDEKPTLIFNLCESLFGQSIHEMHVAGIYELLGIPYTGNSPLVLGTCLNKVRTKEILSHHGIRTARYQIFKSDQNITPETFTLTFPVIVKPLREDASAGIENDSVVFEFDKLSTRVQKIHNEFKQPALVEEYIDGREINVALLGNSPPCVLPISEIDFSGLPDGYHKIVTYSAKWLEGTIEYKGTVGKCPTELPADLEEEVRVVALKVYTIMELRDYARIDMRIDANNQLYVIEVNPNPDISLDAGYIRSAKAAGMTYDDVMEAIVENALLRVKR